MEEIGRNIYDVGVGDKRFNEVHRRREKEEQHHGRAEADDGGKEKGIVDVESLLVVETDGDSCKTTEYS